MLLQHLLYFKIQSGFVPGNIYFYKCFNLDINKFFNPF